jgi:hypothetical protein
MVSSRRLAVLAFLAALAALPLGRAWAAESDPIFAECGIRYPDGFDVNTLADVRGRVVRVEHPDKGPVRFEVDTGTDRYTVLTSPRWYWDDMKPAVSPGDEVLVRGSKSLGTNGRLYVVAEEVRAAGRTVVFRATDGAPLWTGNRATGASGGARSGSPGGFGMGGGAGRGGAGGMNRGGRR